MRQELLIPTVETREFAKKQFDGMTKELGIKHTFSFDEMYDWLLERRVEKAKREEFREKIMSVEKQILATPGTFGEDPFPLVHTFTDGLYVRQVTVPATVLTTTKIHAVNHVFFIQKGTVSILTEDGIVTRTAPYQGITKAGTKRIIYHHNEVIFTTVHATDAINVEDVESEIFATDFNDLEDRLEARRLALFVKEAAKEDYKCQE